MTSVVGRATKIEFNYIDGKDKDKQVASVSGNLSQLVERVDVMAEIPQFVKNIVSGVAGARPYIYQYANEFTIDINNGDGEKVKEDGVGFTEVTFISD